MNRKIKLAIAALLGFSTACSTVKNAPRQSEQTPDADTVKIERPRVVVMYGVRPARPLKETEMPAAVPAPESTDSLKTEK